MSYLNYIESNGFHIGLGRIMHRDFGVLLDIENEKIKNAIDTLDINLLSAIKNAILSLHEIDAIRTFEDFEHYFCQGHNWHRALDYHSFKELESYKEQALIVMSSALANEATINQANVFLRALDGDIPEYIPTERELIYKKQARFTSQRAKWLKKLIERSGYVCSVCESKSDLCVKHLISITNGGETELSNLALRCRKCLNKN